MGDLDRMLDKIRRIKSGGGVQMILDAARRIMGNPIAMFDTEYRLSAFTAVQTDDPILSELIEKATFCESTRRFFEEESFVAEIANATQSALLTSRSLKYDRLLGKLLNKNGYYVASLMLVGCERPIEDDDRIAFDAVCALVSREISGQDYYQQYEKEHQDRTIKKLIEGNYDLKIDIARVSILYEMLGSNLYVAVVALSEGIAGKDRAVNFRDYLKVCYPHYRFAVIGDRVVVLISTDDVLKVEKELDGLVKHLGKNNCYAGISTRFENLFQLRQHYDEAIKSLGYVLMAKSSQHIFPYDPRSLEVVEQIEALQNGGGIQYLLDEAPRIFGNPVLFHDMELNLLGCSKTIDIIDPIWQELVTYGTSSSETIELFKTEGYIALMDGIKTGAFLLSDKIKYDRISWRIYSCDEVRIGCTSIVNTHKKFCEDELVLFGVFSRLFCGEVEKIESYNDYGRVYSDTIINKLICGKMESSFYSQDVGNLYKNLMDNLYLVVVDTALCEGDKLNLTVFRKLFNWPGTVNRYAIYDSQIVIIISIESAPMCHGNFEGVRSFFETHKVYVGLSERFDSIYDVQKYYLQAVEALRKGKNGGIGHIFKHKEE